MKQKAILTSLTTLTLLAGSGVASSAETIFSFQTNGILVSEGETNPILPSAKTTATGTVKYTPSLWIPGGVTSAYLTFSLGDTPSANAPTFTLNGVTGNTYIHPVREWAKLTSVTDGTQSLATPLPASVEVDPEPFVVGQTINATVAGHVISRVTTATDVTNAADAGIKNMFSGVTVATSVGNYFNVDVKDLINSSNTGLLNFALGVDTGSNINGQGKYPNIAYSTSPTSAYAAMYALTGGIGLTPGQPIWVIEQYMFKGATLTVNYTPAPVPVPGAVWLFGSALAGFIGFRRKSV